MFISVFSVPNTKQVDAFSEIAGRRCEYKVIVFHCLNEAQQKQIVKETQFCVVGDYLCHRVRSKRVVWVTRLKDMDEDYIPETKLDDDDLFNLSLLKDNAKSSTDLFYSTIRSRGLNIVNMVLKSDVDHIQMTEVPKAYFTTLQSQSNMHTTFYDSLL